MFVFLAGKDVHWVYGSQAGPDDERQEQRSQLLLGDIVESECETGQTILDSTRLLVQYSRLAVYVADGSECAEDVPPSGHDIKTKRLQIFDTKRPIVTLQRAKRYPFECTRTVQHKRLFNRPGYSELPLECGRWMDRRTQAVTRLVGLMPDDKIMGWFVNVPPARENSRVDSGFQCQPKLNSRRAGGKFGVEDLASLLVHMSKMLQTDNRAIEISESIIAFASDKEKGYVAEAGVERSTCTTSKKESFSREADRSCWKTDMPSRGSDAGLVSVDSSFYHDVIAFVLMAPPSAFVISSWGIIGDFLLCTRDHSGWFLLGSSQVPAMAEFILAAVIYSIATTVYALHRHNESLQGEISSVVFILSAVGGLWLNFDLQTIVLCIFPWTIIVALLLSSGLHSMTWISRCSADLKAYENF